MADREPANAQDVRRVVEEQLAALRDSPGLHPTTRVEWRGEQLDLPVITMPVELLSYNPDTHRVRAQRSLHPSRDRDLTARPFGPDAQAYLHDLLIGDPSDPSKTDPTFEALKENLHEHGQTDPGIVNSSGGLDQRQHTLRGSKRTRSTPYPGGRLAGRCGFAGYPVDRAVVTASEGLQARVLLHELPSGR